MLKPFFTLLFILCVSALFAAIEVRDTTPLTQCDTIIDKNGVVSPVKILSVGTAFITYKQCSEGAKKIYTIAVSQIGDIKSNTFKFEKPKSIPLLTKVKRAKTLSIISIIAFFLTTAGILDSDNPPLALGIIALFAIFAVVGSAIYILALLRKAKKVGDKEAQKAALKSVFAMLLTILLSLFLISRGGCY